MAAQFLGGSGIYIPLFSFHTIIDTDLGLINYVFKEFRNEEIFDLNVLDYGELINKVYYRQFSNPLYVLMKHPDSEQDKQFLDECYEEFIDTKEQEILDNSLSTQIAELLLTFKTDKSIIPNIYYYTNKQLEYLTSIVEFEGVEFVPITQLYDKAKSSYSQIFVKYIEELNLFSNVKDREFYILDTGLNLDKERIDFKQSDILDDTLERNNQISIINLYREDIIGKDIYKYGN